MSYGVSVQLSICLCASCFVNLYQAVNKISKNCCSVYGTKERDVGCSCYDV